MTTPMGRNWVYHHGPYYWPHWHSYPNVTLWAIAWFQGGP